MNINKILNADYLDILYEGRNKAYGSYELRKKYQRRVTVAGLIAILVIGGAFASTLIKPKEVVVAELPPEMKETKLTEPPPLEPNKPKPPPPPSTPPPPVKPTVKFTPPVIKKNEEVKEDEKPDPPKKEENKVVGPAKVEGTDNPDAIDPSLNNKPGNGPAGPVASDPPKDEIFRSVEQMPEFPGGPEALRKYLANNIRYPNVAKEEGIEGRVVVQFVVDRDGSVNNVTILRDLGGGCGKEAVRVVNSMPKWKPGKQNGQAAKVYYTLPVSFKLQ